VHHPSTLRLCASAQKETRISYVATRWAIFVLHFCVIKLTIKHSGCIFISQDHLHGTMSIIIINNRSISQTSWTLKYAHAENICAADAAAGGGHCRYGLHTTYLNIHVDTNACRRVLLFVHGLECGVSGALWFAMIVHIHIYNTAHDLPLPIYPHNAHMHKVCNAACSSSSMPAAQQASKQQQKSTTMKQMSRILPQLPPQLRLRGGALPLDILGLSLCLSLSLSQQTHLV